MVRCRHINALHSESDDSAGAEDLLIHTHSHIHTGDYTEALVVFIIFLVPKRETDRGEGRGNKSNCREGACANKNNQKHEELTI